MFYNYDIGFYSSIVYKNDFGEEVKGDMELVYECKCDIQPYSSEITQKEYGNVEEVTHKIYCEIAGEDFDFVLVLGQKYLIKSIVRWDNYQVMMVQLCQT